MGQEAEKEINFESLKAIVDGAIKNEGISAIEATDDEKQLRYIQKYTEFRSSKSGSAISFESYRIGTRSISFAIIAIGVSYALVGFSDYISTELWLKLCQF